ncbi:ABC transporter ATP-binding protein [Desulfoluna butyratoxydans]|uniref:Abc transporter-like n=1 Tax=Desulfoluna butyratoxydans TaxID=231438 RepID=A0A4U8YYN4_9BACT|nr:ABC transporter ATP-binding protein [Desulfoluna butyratoxydans]VFQ47302.1 abc transporter-like [Desulfoluna butyratoxydans]
MSNIITVNNLGKKYTLGHHKQREYQTFRDSLSHGVRRFYQRMRYPLSQNANATTQNEFWALQGINFEMKQGDRLGIIGRNGAGKSTLLKILSRITHPTAGKIHIKGRVASLLEVGTGFHPELTGRENIFLNGAILGMTKNDIKKRFDEIVAFAEIEKFLDTPVKRYSSGMYVRLAFAVAAHLEPEILIVDEVLAVGDIQFQEKCIGKMKETTDADRTVIFVSHNLGAIESLCSRVCVLDGGTSLYDGDVEAGIQTYTSALMEQNASWSFENRKDRQGSGVLRILSFQILDHSGTPVDIAMTGKDYTFRFKYASSISYVRDLDFSFTIRDMKNINLFRNNTRERGLFIPEALPPTGFIDCKISRLPLTAGRYGFGFRLLVNGLESDYLTGPFAAYFDVVGGDYYGTGQIPGHTPLVIDHDWELASEL